jgi:hypothetical protein
MAPLLDRHDTTSLGCMTSGQTRARIRAPLRWTVRDHPAFPRPPRRSTEPDLFFNGFSLEASISPHLWKHFGLKAGVICEGNFETTMFQPVVLGTLRF